MTEFSIIDRFCTNLGIEHSDTKVTVGDDAAVIRIPAQMELAVSADAMVEGVHFLNDTAPELLAHKILAVNLSDMAAMGAVPKWATLALTLATIDQAWLAEFSKSLDRLASQYEVQIIGGDTTQGPLNLSMTIMGLLPIDQRLTRSGAQVGDEVYVSNILGDAALALSCLEGVVELPEQSVYKLRTAFDTPIPQVALGQKLLGTATACIDISDGLIADLGHIATQSQVGIEVDIEQIPVSSTYQDYLACGGDLDLALTGGDDYQLAFTASSSRSDEIEEISNLLNVPITKIGRVVEYNGQAVTPLLGNEPYVLQNTQGYQHFSD